MSLGHVRGVVLPFRVPESQPKTVIASPRSAACTPLLAWGTMVAAAITFAIWLSVR